MAHGKVEKTNAARLLDRAKINYELVPYEVDEEHLAATHVAEQLGEEIATVFKTLVLKGDRTGYFVCVVPGNHEVDLKAAARVSGNKKADEGTAARDGLYTRRLFAGRHEKALPDLYPLFGRGASVHLYQRRRPGPATENRPGRADSIRRGDRG